MKPGNAVSVHELRGLCSLSTKTLQTTGNVASKLAERVEDLGFLLSGRPSPMRQSESGAMGDTCLDPQGKKQRSSEFVSLGSFSAHSRRTVQTPFGIAAPLVLPLPGEVGGRLSVTSDSSVEEVDQWKPLHSRLSFGNSIDGHGLSSKRITLACGGAADGNSVHRAVQGSICGRGRGQAITLASALAATSSATPQASEAHFASARASAVLPPVRSHQNQGGHLGSSGNLVSHKALDPFRRDSGSRGFQGEVFRSPNVRIINLAEVPTDRLLSELTSRFARRGELSMSRKVS